MASMTHTAENSTMCQGHFSSTDSRFRFALTLFYKMLLNDQPIEILFGTII